MSDIYPPGEHVPFCMGPDGGGACVGYRALYDNWLDRIRLIETLENAVLEQSARINEMRAALRNIGELSKECADDVSPIGAIQRTARAALAPEQDK